jgi:hypothetical protein
MNKLALSFVTVEFGDAVMSCQNRIDTDLGRCDVVPGPHARTVMMSALGTTASISVGLNFSEVCDAEHHRLPINAYPSFTVIPKVSA